MPLRSRSGTVDKCFLLREAKRESSGSVRALIDQNRITPWRMGAEIDSQT